MEFYVLQRHNMMQRIPKYPASNGDSQWSFYSPWLWEFLKYPRGILVCIVKTSVSCIPDLLGEIFFFLREFPLNMPNARNIAARKNDNLHDKDFAYR